MKKLVSLVGCAVLFSALPAHAIPGGRVKPTLAQSASAMYLVRDAGGGHSLYVAWAGESVTDKGARAWAAIGRSACRERRSSRGTSIMCRVRVRPRTIPAEGFTMDPALGSATLDARVDGHKHTASWTGTGDPDVFPFFFQSTFGFPPFYLDADGAAYAVAMRAAKSTAKLFGRKIRGGIHGFALLEEYAVARFRAWSDLETEEPMIKISRRFEIPGGATH